MWGGVIEDGRCIAGKVVHGGGGVGMVGDRGEQLGVVGDGRGLGGWGTADGHWGHQGNGGDGGGLCGMWGDCRRE